VLIHQLPLLLLSLLLLPALARAAWLSQCLNWLHKMLQSKQH
jgi:hypothetical protein